MVEWRLRGGQPWNKGKKLPQFSGENHPNWRGGAKYNLPYIPGWQTTLSRAIRERDNYICQVCSLEGFFVHHIDYNRSNNDPKNLITLCNSCHSKTNFHRNKWEKYFNKRAELKAQFASVPEE